MGCFAATIHNFYLVQLYLSQVLKLLSIIAGDVVQHLHCAVVCAGGGQVEPLPIASPSRASAAAHPSSAYVSLCGQRSQGGAAGGRWRDEDGNAAGADIADGGASGLRCWQWQTRKADWQAADDGGAGAGGFAPPGGGIDSPHTIFFPSFGDFAVN